MAICQSALKFGAKGIEASPFPLGHAAESSRRVWRAIINSSFVHTTQAETLLSRGLIRGPPASFAVSSRSPLNLAIIRQAAFNILKADPSKGSLRRKRLRACVDPNFRSTLFAA
ncbi:MAG: hypothetical protein WBS22_05650 [Methylocystis sp.]